MTEQSSKWHATRKARMDEMFSGRKFEIVSEETLDEPLETVLGYKAKKGYWLRSGDVKIWVGKSLLNTLADEYNAVEKPEPKRRGRPRKQPLAQAEEWAARDMPDTASPITQAGPTYVNPNADEEA